MYAWGSESDVQIKRVKFSFNKFEGSEYKFWMYIPKSVFCYYKHSQYYDKFYDDSSGGSG